MFETLKYKIQDEEPSICFETQAYISLHADMINLAINDITKPEPKKRVYKGPKRNYVRKQYLSAMFFSENRRISAILWFIVGEKPINSDDSISFFECLKAIGLKEAEGYSLVSNAFKKGRVTESEITDMAKFCLEEFNEPVNDLLINKLLSEIEGASGVL